MKKASEIIDKMLENSAIESAASYTSLFRGWEGVAGRDIASHSRIVDVKNGTAVLEADHPAWLQIIQLKQKHILHKIQKMYPELKIESIRMFQGSAAQAAGSIEKTGSRRAVGEQRKDVKKSPEYEQFMSLLERLRKKHQ